MSFISLGGKYSGVLTKKLKNGLTTFYIKYRDYESKSVRKKVGVSPEMTKVKALQILFKTKEEIRAQKELAENPNDNIPKILRKKIDTKLYTLNDLAYFYFHDNTTKTNRAMQNKYNYHFASEPLANKNVNLITENDITDFLEKKSIQRADKRRSNSNNITKLHEEGSISKRKCKPKDFALTLEERERKEYFQNDKKISKLEMIIESNLDYDTWREKNKIKLLKEKNKVLSYRLSPESTELLLRDKTLNIDKLNTLRGILSRKTVKEMLLLASTIITYANRHKKLNIKNEFNIKRGDKNYLKVDNIKPRYLTIKEIKDYLKEAKKITQENPETHNYLYLISLLALTTAARRNTILSIKIEDIDLDNNNIQLRNYKKENNFTSTIANPVIKNEIIRIIGNRPVNSFLFESSVTDLSMTNFPPKMKEILDYTVNCHKSYLNYLTIKEFRNTVASHLAMNGTAIAHIAQVLDHSSTRTTEVYAQLAPSAAKEDLAKFAEDFLNVD